MAAKRHNRDRESGDVASTEEDLEMSASESADSDRTDFAEAEGSNGAETQNTAEVTEGISLERLDLNSLQSAKDAPEEAQSSLILGLQAEVKENYDKYLRSVADLDNFRKRSARERSELLKYSGEALARDLLETVDNLERAIALAPEEGGPFVEGVRLVLTNFLSTLERHGIRGESGVGSEFDPTKHEALATIPTSDVPAGQIMEEYRKAYFIKDKLLRAGQVIVAAAPE